MQIIGTFTEPQASDEVAPSDAERQRLGLERTVVMSEKRPDGESTFYLFADQGLIMHPPGAPSVVLNRAEVVQLYTFLTAPGTQRYVLALVRAQLLDHPDPTTRRLLRRALRVLDRIPWDARKPLTEVIGG